MPKIKIDDASAPQLRHYARNVANLDVAQTENSASLRAKILQADPSLTEIDIPDELVTNGAATPPAASTAPAQAKAKSIPAGRAGQHYAHDPKVELTVMGTADATRAKDVQIAVGGDTILIKRDRKVSIPYRHFLALKEAVETVARDTDEINPTTGLPLKEWVEQPSYPYQVHSMPSPDEIEAWEKRTSAIEMA